MSMLLIEYRNGTPCFGTKLSEFHINEDGCLTSSDVAGYKKPHLKDNLFGGVDVFEYILFTPDGHKILVSLCIEEYIDALPSSPLSSDNDKEKSEEQKLISLFLKNRSSDKGVATIKDILNTNNNR